MHPAASFDPTMISLEISDVERPPAVEAVVASEFRHDGPYDADAVRQAAVQEIRREIQLATVDHGQEKTRFANPAGLTLQEKLDQIPILQTNHAITRT